MKGDESERMSEAVKAILDVKFHAVNFLYKGVPYGFAGWWILYWGTDDELDKIYDSKEEFLSDKIFDGRTFEEAQNEITDLDFEFEP